MAQSDEPVKTKHYYGGQIGLAIVAISVCAVCGVAWLAASPGSGNAALSYSSASEPQSVISVYDSANVSEPVVVTVPVPEDEIFRTTSVGRTATGQDSSAGGSSAIVAAAVQYAIIVKFDAEPALEEIGRNFRKDPEGSRARFQAWAASKPALEGLKLERASYSGELLLTGSGSRSLRTVISEIEAMDNVAYVEPDYSAKAGKEE